MTIAILGSNGQLGRALAAQLGGECIELTRADIDISDECSVQQLLDNLTCDAVVNCAAYTQVDRAEQETAACRAVNADGAAYLAAACDLKQIPFVHISTDYVFGQEATGVPWRETDPPAPQGEYATAKLEGERRVAAACQRHFIVRTCGLYGKSPQANNFVEKILSLAGERDLLRIVDDQHCTPTYVEHLAPAVCFLLGTQNFGLYHIVNEGATTWFKFARELFRQAGIEVRIERITTEEFGAPAPRPRYSVLDTTKYRSLGGPKLPSWQTAIGEYLAQRETN